MHVHNAFLTTCTCNTIILARVQIHPSRMIHLANEERRACTPSTEHMYSECSSCWYVCVYVCVKHISANLYALFCCTLRIIQCHDCTTQPILHATCMHVRIYTYLCTCTCKCMSVRAEYYFQPHFINFVLLSNTTLPDNQSHTHTQLTHSHTHTHTHTLQ